MADGSVGIEITTLSDPALGLNDVQIVAPERHLGFVDRFLTIWILGAMILGVLIGYYSPNTSLLIEGWSAHGVNWPIAIGLIVMMFPPLARVKYDKIWQLIESQFNAVSTVPEINTEVNGLEITHMLSSSDSNCGDKCVCHEDSNKYQNAIASNEPKFKKMLGVSVAVNWFVGPFLMFFLAIAFLPDNHLPYIRGLIMVGIARCIAMVIIWNDLAFGSSECAAVLICLNSIFQMVCYSPYAYFFVSVLLPAFKLQESDSSQPHNINISFVLILESVAIYLGIPFMIGFGSWYLFNRTLLGWKQWYKEVFITYTAPLTLIALLFTIIIMFILKGHLIVSIPLEVIRVAMPLCAYFIIMFTSVYYICHLCGFAREDIVTLAFTSASNNFELAIAVSIAVFGLNSPEAFVGVIGPLVEVPVMLGFVHFAKVLNRWWPAHQNARSVMHDTDTDEAHTQAAVVVSAINSFNDSNAYKVLFVCTGNSCRSHMAQGWCWYYFQRALAGDASTPSILAYSAGTAPVVGRPGPINQSAVRVMLEKGIDISRHCSKNLEDLHDMDFDLVITVCDDAAQECPSYPCKKGRKRPRVVHHAFDDPPRLCAAAPSCSEHDSLDNYRRVCSEIQVFIRDELTTLLFEK